MSEDELKDVSNEQVAELEASDKAFRSKTITTIRGHH